MLTNAFRHAESIGRPGAAFVSLPQDILVGPAEMRVLGQSIQMGGGHEGDIARAADIINAAGKLLSLAAAQCTASLCLALPTAALEGACLRAICLPHRATHPLPPPACSLPRHAVRPVCVVP